MSWTNALSGATYKQRTPLCKADHGVAAGFRPVNKRSRIGRKAASVLPEPVGAAISRLSPAATTGQEKRCAAVGSPNVWQNQRRAGSESESKAPAVLPGPSSGNRSLTEALRFTRSYYETTANTCSCIATNGHSTVAKPQKASSSGGHLSLHWDNGQPPT